MFVAEDLWSSLKLVSQQRILKCLIAGCQRGFQHLGCPGIVTIASPKGTASEFKENLQNAPDVQ